MNWDYIFAKRRLIVAAAVGLLALVPIAARAQVVAPSFYSSAIQVQGELAGTEFDDWAAAGVPVADMDPVDNPGGSPPFVDIANVQIANDDDFIYVHMTTHGGHTSLANLYLAFDTDQNAATGFDPFGIGVLGSEFSYQTDFPFAQDTGVFNTGEPISGGQFGNGGALIYPFWTEEGAPQGAAMEWSVPRNAMISGAPAFANDSFDFAIWADSGLGDISQRINYTLAEAPAGLQGDYNDDGKVDAADYVVWRKNEGTMNILPNDPHGDVIGEDQYNTWREAFGDMSGGGSSSPAVAAPEPTAALLMLMVGFAVAASRHRFS
jgi:hypothetical protein